MSAAQPHAFSGVQLFSCPKSDRALKSRSRPSKRAFHPSAETGAYRLPGSIRERLTASLTGFRNRDAAFTLAVFLARYWSAPGRITMAFPIDRRALAEKAVTIDLTEAQVRGAIRTLEKVGFLDRDIPAPGSRYKATPYGLHRKPVLFRFGPEFAPGFIVANRKAQNVQERRCKAAQTQGASASSLPPVRLPGASTANSPKANSEAKRVLMGNFVKGCREELRIGPMEEPYPQSQQSPLEEALTRLWQAAGFKPI